MLKTATRVTPLIRNLSNQIPFCSRYFSLCNNHDSLQMLRKSQEWQFNCLGARKFSSNMHIIEMRGLDPDSTEEEVTGFFKSLNIKPAKVRLRCDHSGRIAGICEVEFETYSEAVVAMRKKNSFIGNRFVQLRLKSSGTASEKGRNLRAKDSGNCGVSDAADISGGITKNFYSTGHFIRVKGLPHRVTEQAIYDFFWPVNVRPISIKRLYDDNGRPTREFDVEFLTREEAVTAMSKNNACFGRQFVELILKSTEDVRQGGGGQASSETSNISYSSTFKNKNIEIQNVN